jgi:hypothetical protein
MEISPDAGYTKNENLSAIANLALEWSDLMYRAYD